MAHRDRQLLDAAGLSVAEASEILGRSRQAIYSGISNKRSYFAQ